MTGPAAVRSPPRRYSQSLPRRGPRSSGSSIPPCPTPTRPNGLDLECPRFREHLRSGDICGEIARGPRSVSVVGVAILEQNWLVGALADEAERADELALLGLH